MRALLAALVLIVCGPYVAEARDCAAWAHREMCWENVWGNRQCRTVRSHCRRWVYDEARVYGYERREREIELSRDVDRRACRDIRRTVGDQHLTVEGAKKAANDAWAAMVRFHIGEKHMDLNNARHIVYTCSRSSIKEGGVTTLGQSLTRCEIEATPCAPKPEPEIRDER